MIDSSRPHIDFSRYATENVEIWSRLIEQLAGNVILFGMKKGISVQDTNPTRQPNSIFCGRQYHFHLDFVVYGAFGVAGLVLVHPYLAP